MLAAFFPVGGQALVPPTSTEPPRPVCAASGGSDVKASAKDFTMSSSLPTYSAIYAFGDSLSDAGNLSISTSAVGVTTPVSPPYYKQQYGILSGNVFSNGPTWVQNLSIALGLATLAPSLAGGTDFAFGGAQTGSTPQNSNLPAYAAVSLPAQLSEFHTLEPNPSANALYTLSVGANDLDTILATT
jgi:phospholipase/lecithinase/hemolysin